MLDRRRGSARGKLGGRDLALRRRRCLLRVRVRIGRWRRGAPIRWQWWIGGSSGGTSDGTYSKGDSEATPTDQGTYLRGAQVTGADGTAQFTTIYPGWYRGRTVHIHLKVHIDKKTVLTTQLFMDESLNDEAFAVSPYTDHSGRDTTNDNDNIFDESGLLTAQKKSDGYLGVINLGVNV